MLCSSQILFGGSKRRGWIRGYLRGIYRNLENWYSSGHASHAFRGNVASGYCYRLPCRHRFHFFGVFEVAEAGPQTGHTIARRTRAGLHISNLLWLVYTSHSTHVWFGGLGMGDHCFLAHSHLYRFEFCIEGSGAKFRSPCKPIDDRAAVCLHKYLVLPLR